MSDGKDLFFVAPQVSNKNHGGQRKPAFGRSSTLPSKLSPNSSTKADCVSHATRSLTYTELRITEVTPQRGNNSSGGNVNSGSGSGSQKSRRERERVVSLDSSMMIMRERTATVSKRARGRCTSTGGVDEAYKVGLMRRITFEEVDVDGTPLSSRRSCSEFNRIQMKRRMANREQNSKTSQKSKQSSFFTRMFKAFYWGGGGGGDGSNVNSSATSSSISPKKGKNAVVGNNRNRNRLNSKQLFEILGSGLITDSVGNVYETQSNSSSSALVGDNDGGRSLLFHDEIIMEGSADGIDKYGKYEDDDGTIDDDDISESGGNELVISHDGSENNEDDMDDDDSNDTDDDVDESSFLVENLTGVRRRRHGEGHFIYSDSDTEEVSYMREQSHTSISKRTMSSSSKMSWYGRSTRQSSRSSRSPSYVNSTHTAPPPQTCSYPEPTQGCIPFPSSSSNVIQYEHRRAIEDEVIESNKLKRRSAMARYRGSFVSEISATFGMVFGLGSTSSRTKEPMEIELYDLKKPPSATRGIFGNYSPSGNLFSRTSTHSSVNQLFDDEIESRGDIPPPNIPQRTIDRIVMELSASATLRENAQNLLPGGGSATAALNDANATTDTTAVMDSTGLAMHPTSWLWWAQKIHNLSETQLFHSLLAFSQRFTQISRRHFVGPADENFYETIRIQPFASGAYLRGLLAAGFCSLFFNGYSLALWPDFTGEDEEEFTVQQKRTLWLLYLWLVVQFSLNVIQLPARVTLHVRCWESSRATEVEAAINHIRQMVLSDIWIFNRVVGKLQDFISVVGMVCAEVYMWITPASSDPLRSLVVSLCATNLLALTVRIIVTSAFSVSLHDPQVLADARRRGLSRWDMDVLPTFVFTSLAEIANGECACPICLGDFTMGDMLLSLPCDRKHSFHASCIRTWLQRQNSCPLCQKMV